ncbi:MAG: PD40 domain-containing protein [Verrucomicrobia bacterium]|nr:PD40 domain-containing protein [Verrucomicrobiota bacterium]
MKRHQSFRRILIPVACALAVVVAATSATAAPAKPSARHKPEPFTVPERFPGLLLQKFLAGPMTGVEEIVFAVRVPGRDHWYVTFGNYSDYSEYAQRGGFKKEDGVHWGYAEGGRLCRLNLKTGALKVVFEDPKGGVRDPQLHYDGKKILFSYRKGGTHPFHLCEINIDGTGLRQLTDGTDDDIEPAYCPDGSIVFCSSRCRRFVNCWYTRVATLYRCDGDGKNVRCLSSNNDHDNTPWVLPDGRVLYMRWEYVDRSQVHFHHLWTMNPDGTGQTVYYGNMTGGIAMLDAKPIPGSEKVVVAWSPGHGRPEHLGPVATVDPQFGPDDPKAVRIVSKTGEWKDPYAFSENCFLVAHARGLCVMDGEGNAELVYRLPDSDSQFQCHEPRPLTARPRERVVAPRTSLAQETGTLILQDIYQGRNMAGVKRGDIKKLLVLQQLPKPINFSGGMEPLTIGGSFTLAEIVGEAPVEPDGSAHIEVPALRSLFFVALDKDDLAVKRMHSFVTLQPGERAGCVGCHEHRTLAAPPRPQSLMAMSKPPAPVKPISDVPSVLDFPRDIQPILNRHCVSCHNPDKREGGVDLCGDKTAMYSISYWTMQTRGLVNDARNVPYANRAPYSYGSAASRLLKLMDGSHYGAKPTDLERKTTRLWIETSATYPGTYASLGCGSYYPNLPTSAMRQRCGKCHWDDVKDKKGHEYETLVINSAHGRALEPLANIERPEKAYMLLAPLAKEAGGLGLCKEATFKDKNDPLYQYILAALRNAHDQLMAGKRFDMAGFRPNQHYIREMQRFGFLPKDLAPDAPVNIYATDRAYWNSFYYKPPPKLAER